MSKEHMTGEGQSDEVGLTREEMGLPNAPETPGSLTDAELEGILNIFRPRMPELSEDKRMDFENSIKVVMNKDSDPDQVVDALRKAEIFPHDTTDEFIDGLLTDGGHSQIKIDEVKARKDEWTVSAEDLAEEPELDEQEEAEKRARDAEGEDILGDLKGATGLANSATTTEQVDAARQIESKMRSRLNSWLDRNPGKLQKANRLLVRPGVAIALFTIVIYISLLNIATKSATQRIGGGK